MTPAAVVQSVESLRPPSHRRWMEIGAAENAAFMKLVRSLDPDDWSKSTDCPRWTVKDIAAHVLGAAEGLTSFAEMRRQMSASRRRKAELGNQLNAMNQIQVEDRRHLSVDDLVERLDTKLPAFVRLRRRVGGVGKVIPLYDASLLGITTVGYLLDTIYARDVFMHRVDIGRAVGRALELVPEDRELVADVVRDWVRRSKADVHLDLHGPAGGSFAAGDAATRVRADAVEFCRVLSGRGAIDAFEIDGDRATAERAIAAGCPF